ncbi:hypothetical protein QUF80_18570 [Desulfococcaceae bacterium HSG8]|nr:hypothetical protein [Desulfococcaceae bacterium HSG8]
MYHETFKSYFLSSVICLIFTVFCFAGSLDSPGQPASGSGMYSLDEIYNRLDTGASGTGNTRPFEEPASGPANDTGRTLNDVMDKTPAADNTDGSVPADVKSGKKYWGLRTDGSGWGQQTGTMQTRTLSPGSTAMEAGYYDASTLDAADSDLVSGNIKKGVTIFGVTGTFVESVGNATADDVLNGRTFSNADAAGLVGTRPPLSQCIRQPPFYR